MAISVPVIVLSGCTPMHHTIKGNHFTAEHLLAEENDAAKACENRDGATSLPPHPFRTDGCSFWPDSTWQECCVAHDKPYWCGGTAGARKQADQAMRQCILDRNHSWIAAIMYWGTRLGGHPWLPFPWRWGYGWAWPGRYEGP